MQLVMLLVVNKVQIVVYININCTLVLILLTYVLDNNTS